MSRDLVTEFERLVIENLALASKETGHLFTDLYDLFEKHGVIDTARLLMSPNFAGFTYGFRVLASAELLHLSIEQAVIEFSDTDLFTDEQISKARATLSMARLVVTVRNGQLSGDIK